MARLVLWLVGWVWIGRLFILLGFVGAGLYYMDVKPPGCTALARQLLDGGFLSEDLQISERFPIGY